ncbi:MAG: peptide chain release factor N(5)-glutamine methyltransferase [Proteobacteria bacterium]|nr:peptide chain release factor N(5)-glutamine methyltransferase [Pseudomonadota bacterium]NOG61510.1 peptide chain release factor N(5)-glutamine methyltransferase [Pseudomonadota bacterium]
MQIVDALKHARQQFHSSDSAQLDAEILLCSVLRCERSYLYAHPEMELSKPLIEALNKLILLRAQGHPVAYLAKQKEFWSLLFQVDENTLIPRPETEILVEETLKLIPSDIKKNILDLGTGSGAIAIAIASERPLANIMATDMSDKALRVAKLNARSQQIKNIQFKKADWFNIKEIKQYDVIVSNPPYICDDDPHLTQGDVRFEPVTALSSGSDGLNDLRTIIAEAIKHLNKQGWLLVEHGYNQAKQVQILFNENKFTSVSTIKDYSKQDRVTIGQLI